MGLIFSYVRIEKSRMDSTQYGFSLAVLELPEGAFEYVFTTKQKQGGFSGQKYEWVNAPILILVTHNIL